MAALLAVGKTVLTPIGVHSYDLLFEDTDGFHKVQCKTAWLHKGCLLFSTVSRTGNKRDKVTGYIGRADHFGIYAPHTDKCYLMSVCDAPNKEGYLRLDPPRNNQRKGIKFAEDYLIK